MAGRPKSAEKIEEVLGHILSYPGATQWNSLFDEISQISRHKEKLPLLFEQLDIINQVFKDTELQYLSEYCLILKPIANALDILQGENNTYLVMYYLPILNACRSGLLKRFELFFDFSNLQAIIASFTLPQFKLKWINNFKQFSNDDLGESIGKLVLETAQNYNTDYKVESVNKPKYTTSEEDFFEFGDEEFSSSSSSLANNFKKRTELEILQYLTDPGTQLHVLNNYPTIKKLLFRYNTCLPSSAPVERLFSFAEIINAARRHALSDKNFENLVLIKANSDRIL
ncbi:hypothetical protein NQ314_016672 [Rhamnusium bicolor]|uniref:HAT C-terminal dimerisation domain-containing protein n=1 Tax=Rhamnusium bicolor TaxID=1586634 RepID=A0AAV8WW93_9CUCU|nr:hypothetical protein NQ314_016672 [Rhamnusium bicolor]